MWYFSWILGVGFAVLLAIVNALWGENEEARAPSTAGPARDRALADARDAARLVASKTKVSRAVLPAATTPVEIPRPVAACTFKGDLHG